VCDGRSGYGGFVRNAGQTEKAVAKLEMTPTWFLSCAFNTFANSLLSKLPLLQISQQQVISAFVTREEALNGTI
jgi:hypothetical protein